jgi:hypothetical protein
VYLRGDHSGKHTQKGQKGDPTTAPIGKDPDAITTESCAVGVGPWKRKGNGLGGVKPLPLSGPGLSRSWDIFRRRVRTKQPGGASSPAKSQPRECSCDCCGMRTCSSMSTAPTTRCRGGTQRRGGGMRKASSTTQLSRHDRGLTASDFDVDHGCGLGGASGPPGRLDLGCVGE